MHKRLAYQAENRPAWPALARTALTSKDDTEYKKNTINLTLYSFDVFCCISEAITPSVNESIYIMKIRNKFNFPRGTICVGRKINGELIALKIDYPIWGIYSGAFSIL